MMKTTSGIEIDRAMTPKRALAGFSSLRAAVQAIDGDPLSGTVWLKPARLQTHLPRFPVTDGTTDLAASRVSRIL